MDPALLREREAFKKRALATPVVENKKKKESTEDETKKKTKPPPKSTAVAPRIDATNYKHMSGSSQYKFGVLAKIVKHLKTLHQDGADHALTLEDILDETNQLDVGMKISQWLRTEALASNPKIEVTSDGRYMFKPPYRIRDRKGLLKLLRQTDLKGFGGILLDDIQESLPNHEKILKILDKDIVYITRPIDKKKILFYNDKTAHMPIDDEFQKLWRSVAVDGIDDNKIEEYLEKQGIRSMQDTSLKVMPSKLKRKAAPKKRTFKKPRDNEHLKEILEEYE
ncbi:LOW QUALITY PROTEIN: general transcription factor IIE subunit 2-like [Daphnia magna]|uniref:general transcription factor IIE subunit 2 n=1 Tax=Daphnia magna TaxID=35525 RepID=UPI001E1BA9E6|nr:general transcription factor IIE subunit 2 [Daphnia magna]XP_045025237.1 LOW QUALITY PROTEIN: general transcription factor IIE subunit 2-like [Daphnia magna]